MSYYDPTGFALEIFKKRYAAHENETWLEMCDRVGYYIALAEHGPAAAAISIEFKEVLKKNLFIAGGRILYGAGRPRGQILNCFVIPTSDSREGWGKTVSDMIVISGTGGGTGINFTPIRPRGSAVNGSGGLATGAVSLMEGIDSFGNVMKAGGGRRVALMFALSLTHGDIIEFLDKKLDHKELKNANVSIVFDDDPEEFFKKVKNDGELELTFRGKVIGKTSAKEIWSKIVKNALKGGEPGILNMFRSNKMSDTWYFEQLICSNPCGEIALPPHGCCDLGSLVLPRFVDNREIDYDLLGSTVDAGVRFLDDVLDVNTYPLPEIREVCLNERRIGLGVMGLHDMLLKMGLRYSSDTGLETVDKVMGFIKNRAFMASVELAKEKGSFPKFDAEQFLKGGFAKTLKPSVRTAIRLHGIRNCALLTVAPGGTTSMVSAVTSGLEPMFSPAYRRKFQDGDKLKEEIVVHPLFKQFVDAGRSVKHFQGAFDIKLRDHFEMQRVCQRHVDNAVSKTINLPQGTSEDELSDLYMEFLPELKGITVYADGSRENQPLTPMSIDEALEHIKEASEEVSGGKCKSGACEI